MTENGYPIKGGAISTWEKGVSLPNANQFLALCKILDITDIYGTFITPLKQIPLRLMSVSAGTGEYVNDDSYTLINTGILEADYALRINGDSMEPIFNDGDIVAVEYSDSINNKDIGIFYVDGEHYCKILENNKLISANPKYNPILLNHVNTFKILGRVISKNEW
jgi:hypothetical protein